MISQEEMVERILSRVTDNVVDSIKQTVTEVVTRELSSAISRSLLENEFYRFLNDEMRHGLKDIYQKLSSASLDESSPAPDTNHLFNEANRQIDEIMQTTLQATEEIMQLCEQLLQQQESTKDILESLLVDGQNTSQIKQLVTYNENLETSLTSIITSLSFQDLTGQRLKKVVNALTTIQESVFDLYVSTGLMIKTKQEDTTKGIDELQKESKKKVAAIKKSELKGPTLDSSQKDVDDLLSSLGL